MEIDKKDFLMMQPGYPEVTSSDKFYFGVANELAKAISNSNFTKRFGEHIAKETILAVIGYYQDIVADCGIFRSFCTIHEELYHKRLPFFELPDDYIESELNYIDVQFMVWYVTECSIEDNGTISPFDKDIEDVSHTLFDILDSYYEMAPTPEGYQKIVDVELYDEDNIQEVYDLSYWLFWNNYFMRHAAAPTMRNALIEGQKIIQHHTDPEEARPLLLDLNQKVMKKNPTGPLALFIQEWLHTIVDNKSPFSTRKKHIEPHKYYQSFIAATNGNPLKIFSSYEDMDAFLSNDMGWGKPSKEGHLPQVKDHDNFVLYVTPEKGMLVAVDIAQYIKLPDNNLYDSKIAKEEASSLITVQGRCPIDLVTYLFSNLLVPDARFEWDESATLLLDNLDLLSRLYLQSFYRAV